MNLTRIFLLTLIFAISGFIARAQTFQSLFSFANTNGSIPTGLTLGNDGNFYGLADSGGNTNLNFGYGYGTVFKFATNGSLTTLVYFNNTNGASSLAAPTLGKDGNFYGTTYQGGDLSLNFTYGDGSIFRMTPNGILTTLVKFNQTITGANPNGLTPGKDGNFYGTTQIGGGNGDGTIFQVTTNGALTTLVNFNYPTTGAQPVGLTLGNDGNFYGTTAEGGGGNSGTVFQMTPNGTLTTLVSFSGNTNGAYPLAPLTLGQDGNFYGTTHQGGELTLNHGRGFGTIFKVTTNGQLTTLVYFNGTNGASPTTLTPVSDGNFYGLTDTGGNTNLNFGYGYGTVYRLTTNGQLTTLVYFNSTNGASPTGLALGKDGNFYGTTRAGGTGNFGTAFSLLIPPTKSIPPDLTRPTLSFVSPTLNQQWSSPTFTVTGNAADNVAVGNVLYSLNGGSWITATTANGWANWTGSLSLTPGTNTLRAYAVDSSGNHSPTNSVSFEYVVLMPVAVQLYGQGLPNPKSGSLSPNYTNGIRLAINENYSVTATPAASFAFTNWTDGSGKLLTNGTTLRFTMAPSLSLRANFIDGVAPTLSIVSPKLKQQLSNPTFTVAGKAADNVAVAHVLYSLNGGSWTNATTANEWTNWAGSLALTPGTNTLRAYAVDTSGNRSPTNSLSFEYVVLMPVTAQIYGLGVPNPRWGSLRPTFSSQSFLPVNEKSTVTAKASHGFAFTNWTDGAGKLLTNGTTLQFIMTTNLALHANFVDTTRPKLSILTPKARQKLISGTIVATGKATDNVAVQAVFCSLNGSAWLPAGLTTNSSLWSATLSLSPGTNVVRAYARDSSGNLSPTNSVSFEYQIVTQLAASQSSAQRAVEPTAPAVLAPLAPPANGQFALSITGTPGQTYIVQVSADLLNWTPVATNQSPFTFVDTNAGNYQQRFYRSLAQ